MQNFIRIILEITIYSSIMILAVLGIKALFLNKLDGKIISFLWLIVLFRLLLPVTFESPIHMGVVYRLFTENTLGEENTEDSITDNADESNINLNNTVPSPAIAEYDNVTAVYEPTAAETAKNIGKKINIWTLVTCIWLSGTVILMTKRIYRIISFKLKIKDVQPANRQLITALKKAKESARIKQDIEIAESFYVDIPVVYGTFKPVILLPIGFAQSISDKKLNCILVHELCHIKRNDVIKSYLWLIARTIHWFNPLVQLAYKNYVEDVEQLCDETVLRLITEEDICEYTQSLLDVIRLTKRSTKLPITVSLFANTTTIRKRVMNMIKPQKKSKTAGLLTILIISIMIFACFTTACQKEDVSTPDIEMDTPVSENENPVEIEDGTSAVENLGYLMQSEIESIELTRTEDFFGDKIEFYACNGHKGSYRILTSNNSLISFSSKEIDTSMTKQLSDDEFEAIAADYAKSVWGYDNVTVTSHEDNSYDLSTTETAYLHSIEGIMGRSDRAFIAEFNGNGDLAAISSYPQDVDYSKGVSAEAAKQKAVELIKEDASFVEDDNLVIISEESSTGMAYAPMYVFEYQYRSENPTTEHYDFDARVSIIMATGELGGIEITPVTLNLADTYSIEEAGTMAVEHIAENTEHKDLSKYEIKEAWSQSMDDEIIYTFMIDYDSKYSYSLMMTATGEFWDIAGGE